MAKTFQPTISTQAPQGPGMESQGPLTAGYNAALQNLMGGFDMSGQAMQGQQKLLRQQYQNQLGDLQQQMTNRGLGGTSIAQTMQQGPMRTYNQGMADLSNQNALRQMQMLQAMAGMQAQGGQQQSQMMAPYAQSLFAQQLGNQQQGQGNYLASRQAAFNQMNLPFTMPQQGPAVQQPPAATPYGSNVGGMVSGGGSMPYPQMQSPQTVGQNSGLTDDDMAYLAAMMGQ
jgi:hypothetical protein